MAGSELKAFQTIVDHFARLGCTVNGPDARFSLLPTLQKGVVMVHDYDGPTFMRCDAARLADELAAIESTKECPDAVRAAMLSAAASLVSPRVSAR